MCSHRQRLLSGDVAFPALSFFTDTPELRLFGDGNTWQSIVGASALLWIVHFLILRGVQTAASINLDRGDTGKIVAAGSVCCAGDDDVQTESLKLDFTGLALGVPVWEQVKNTMLITLWVFIWCGRCRGCLLRVRVINVMLAKRHCWRFVRSGRLFAGNAAFAGRGGTSLNSLNS